MEIPIPADARMIINCLEQAGYTAVLVGGCVRDSLLNRTPGDWDIATSARPEQVIDCFSRYSVLKTGMQHGTVTVLVDHNPYEVTTFRVDGTYSDNRRPDSVTFVDDLREDLARRDFTVNALAWHPVRGLTDYFGGRQDLAAKRINCVGDPAVRFGEDALRILRAVRFASTLEFAISPETAASMAALAPSLANIAPERIRTELCKALLGPGMQTAFSHSPQVLYAVLPELRARINSSDWPSVMQAVSAVPKDLAVRLALLIGGCGEQAAAVARGILLRLRFDNDTRLRTERLLVWRCGEVDARQATVRQWLNRLGIDDFERMLALWQSDARPGLEDVRKSMHLVLSQNQCYRLRDLAVGGDDLIAIGVPKGQQVGKLLSYLLEAVIDGSLLNQKDALLAAAKSDMIN